MLHCKTHIPVRERSTAVCNYFSSPHPFPPNSLSRIPFLCRILSSHHFSSLFFSSLSSPLLPSLISPPLFYLLFLSFLSSPHLSSHLYSSPLFSPLFTFHLYPHPFPSLLFTSVHPSQEDEKALHLEFSQTMRVGGWVIWGISCLVQITGHQ